MCSLTVSDFDALDTLDADAVLAAGEIKASEKRAEKMRLVVSPRVKGGVRILQKSIAGEVRNQKAMEKQATRVAGEKPAGVVVH